MKLLIDVQCLREIDPRTGIQRYALELTKAIARNTGGHELWVATGTEEPDTVERLFGKWIPRERILRFAVPTPAAENTSANVGRTRVAECIREAFIADQAPDVVHLTSLVWENTVTSVAAFEDRPKTAVTHYDLIPFLRPAEYLPVAWLRDWYQRKIQWLRNADLLLAISEYSKQEAVNALGIQSDRIVVIPGAANSQFKPAPPDPGRQGFLWRKYGIGGAFLLCVNVADHRKNTDRLIRAFGLLPSRSRADRQLVIVGTVSEQVRADYRSIAHAAGLSDGDLVITGFVPDSDLRLLYSFCELFVSPSIHEGLGLPILEAMACGAPVIGSHASSIPEVVGRADALFDPENPKAITAKMDEVLSQPAFSRSLREWSAVQARRFDWDRSARLVWNAFARLHRRPTSCSRPDAATPKSKPRLAYVISCAIGDQPPCAGYIALMREISHYYDLQIVAAQISTERTVPFACHDLNWFETHAGTCDRIVYDVSSQYCTGSLQQLMEQWPGVLILRDIAFGECMYRAEAANPKKWLRTLYEEHGIAAAREFAITGDAVTYTCMLRMIQNSTGTIVCTGDALATLQASLGAALAQQVKPLFELQAVSWELCTVNDSIDVVAGNLNAHLERFFHSHPNARLNRLIDCIGPNLEHLAESDLGSVAECISANRTFAQPRILLDAGLLLHDQPGGVPRVGKNIVDQLTRKPRPGVRVEPVLRHGSHLRTCSEVWKKLGVAEFGWVDSPIEPVRTDRLLALELSIDAEAIALLKRRQVAMYFVLYDILSIRYPSFFVEGGLTSFARCLKLVSTNADGIICISRTVADDFNDWLIEQRIPRSTPLHIGWFHLGADLPFDDNVELSREERTTLNQALTRSLALIVGSLEYRSDRKGYEQTLNAFELLWSRGNDLGLVFVGQRVSPNDELTERITHHREYGRRLFWFEKPGDHILTLLYRSAAVLLYPSHGEGFGLPLVEAAWHDLPVLARDLPVFREIAGQQISYFDGYGGSDLAAAIELFFALKRGNKLPSSAAMNPLTWAQSAEQLVSIILDDNWYLKYGPTK